jgi:hypothetical protein
VVLAVSGSSRSPTHLRRRREWRELEGHEALQLARHHGSTPANGCTNLTCQRRGSPQGVKGTCKRVIATPVSRRHFFLAAGARLRRASARRPVRRAWRFNFGRSATLDSGELEQKHHKPKTTEKRNRVGKHVPGSSMVLHFPGDAGPLVAPPAAVRRTARGPPSPVV